MSERIRTRRHGFTLVETQVAVAVAVVIMAVITLVSVYCWRSFYTGVGRGQSLQTASLVLETIEQDLMNARISRPEQLESEPEEKAWRFPISARAKSGEVEERTMKYRIVPRKGTPKAFTLERNGRPMAAVRLTDLAFAWSKTPGHLIVEVEATDTTGRWVTRMGRDIPIRALQQWAMFGQYFGPPAGPAKSTTTTTQRRS